MTLAAVNVLPEPVTPSSVWWRLPGAEGFRQFGDGLGLVTAWLVIGGKLEIHKGSNVPQRAALPS